MNSVFLLMILYMLMNPVTQPEQQVSVDLDPVGKTEAWAAVTTWLDTGVLGVGTRIVSWDGDTVRTSTDGNTSVKTHRQRFTVTDGGRWWRVDATIAQDGTMIDSPAVTVIKPKTGGGTYSGWDNVLDTLTPSDALTTLVSQWGEAVTGMDGNRLKIAMSDPNGTYQPLMLHGAQSVTISRAAYLRRGNFDTEQHTGEYAVARVNITLKPGDDKASVGLMMSFDLLVHDPLGSPKILAWGAPGDGPTLREHANRVSDPLTETDVNTLTNQRSDDSGGDSAESAHSDGVNEETVTTGGGE